MALSAAAAGAVSAVLQVAPLVIVEAGNPILCGYRYSFSDGVELRVEKGVREGAVFTAVDVLGANSARLQTTSFDSTRDLREVFSSPGRVRLEADLEQRDSGGLLFAELGVMGGVLHLGRGHAGDPGASPQWTTRALTGPLPRDVTATYLNCAGDLIRPEPSVRTGQ